MTRLHAAPTSLQAAGPVARRADIQGLRALAVGLVAFYHFFPALVPGGFVGVDVFFVISGYLITSLVLREISRTGTLSLVDFYARRVRRLVPAALTVTLVTLLLSSLVLAPVDLRDAFEDAAWTSVYLANWHYSQDTTGYFAQVTPSPFLHFWSLAVEEQFYLVWPAVVIIVLLCARKRLAPVLGGVLGVVFAGSFALSILLTHGGSVHAYYSLAARAWELSIGGLLAVAVHRGYVVRHRAVAAGGAVVGLGLVAAASVLLTEGTPFPGWVALVPTLGAALVLWAGTGPQSRAQRALGVSPARFVGDISYSLYLWHWPVLVLGSVWLGDLVGGVTLALLLGLSGVLAAATYRWVETRTGRLLARPAPRRVVVGGVAVAIVSAGTAVVLVGVVSLSAGGAVPPAHAVARTVAVEAGSVTVTPLGPGRTPGPVPSNASPTLGALSDDVVEPAACAGAVVAVCAGGEQDSETVVVLVGDSHAAQWWPAAERAAAEHGWSLFLVSKQGCPLTGTEIAIEDDRELLACQEWQGGASPTVKALEPDLVVVANHTERYLSQYSSDAAFPGEWRAGTAATLVDLSAESRVLLMGQIPAFDYEPAVCLGDNLEDVSACSMAPEDAVPAEVRALNEDLAGSSGALYFDPSLLLCGAMCPQMDQNLVMYRDAGHLSRTYAAYLAGDLGSVLAAALAA